MAGLSADVGVVVGDLDLRVTLDVPPASTVAVLGPNGAGKTTLLRALCGLVPVTPGSRVVLDGVDLTDAPTESRPVGVVFQEHVLFPHLSAVDNVAFGLRARGVGRDEARRRASDWLERVGLGGRGADRPSVLSGGQAQRVALARAMATEPRLLLLDEPLAALDVTTRRATRRDLRRRLADHDGVRVVVTHDPVEAASLAERLVVLEGGRVTHDGTAAELAARPRSAYVADLVGVNLLAGRARRGVVEVAAGGRLVVADAPEGDVRLVVHPRAVAIHRHRPEGTPRNVWAATIDDLDREGERVRLRLAGPVPLVAEVTSSAVADLALAPGGEVWASLKATEIGIVPD